MQTGGRLTVAIPRNSHSAWRGKTKRKGIEKEGTKSHKIIISQLTAGYWQNGWLVGWLVGW